MVVDLTETQTTKVRAPVMTCALVLRVTVLYYAHPHCVRRCVSLRCRLSRADDCVMLSGSEHLVCRMSGGLRARNNTGANNLFDLPFAWKAVTRVASSWAHCARWVAPIHNRCPDRTPFRHTDRLPFVPPPTLVLEHHSFLHNSKIKSHISGGKSSTRAHLTSQPTQLQFNTHSTAQQQL